MRNDRKFDDNVTENYKYDYAKNANAFLNKPKADGRRGYVLRKYELTVTTRPRSRPGGTTTTSTTA